jgi:2-C-methyl-D-erythritol 4-phosphate cytidylyltransferase
MRTRAFGQEPPGTLLDSETVAHTSLDVLLSPDTGHIYDVRKDDPLSGDTTQPEGPPV